MPRISTVMRLIYISGMLILMAATVFAIIIPAVEDQFQEPPTPPPPTPVPTEVPPEPPLEVQIITALAVEPWVSQAAETYNASERTLDGRPVVIEVIPMQGLSALNKWSRGEFDRVPTVWLAESRIWIEQANAATLDRSGQDIFLNGGRYRAQPVALSPLVWGIWETPYTVLADYFSTEELSWDEMHEAAVQDSWAALNGDPDWGNFKLVVAHPVRDPAGLTAMVGAAGEYFDNPGLTSDELQDPEFLNWLADLFDTVVDFSPVGAENMLLYGRSNGDAGQLVESFLLTQMAGVESRWGEAIQIVYPDPISWFDFPYAIYMGNETSAEEKQAALEFKDYILSAEQQAIALEYGLRPACPECPIDGGLIAEWQPIGVLTEIPSASRMRPASIRGLENLTEWYMTRYEE